MYGVPEHCRARVPCLTKQVGGLDVRATRVSVSVNDRLAGLGGLGAVLDKALEVVEAVLAHLVRGAHAGQISIDADRVMGTNVLVARVAVLHIVVLKAALALRAIVRLEKRRYGLVVPVTDVAHFAHEETLAVNFDQAPAAAVENGLFFANVALDH